MKLAKADPFFFDALPTIPDRITTKIGFEIDTTGPVWQFPPQLGISNPDWSKIRTTPELLATAKGYVASQLETKTERHASNEYFNLTRIRWELLTTPLAQHGEIRLEDVLAVQADIKRRFPKAWTHYWPVVKRFYGWAATNGVPGFPTETMFHLNRMRPKKRPSLDAKTRIAPGVAVSKALKHRQCYDDITTARIEAALMKATRDIRDGKANPRIKLSGIVMTYLAMDHGQRPFSFSKLRESHFEVRETEGAICYWLEVPATKGRDQKSFIERTMWRQLSSVWGGLIAELIAANRAEREGLGLDNSLDWPLFPVAQTGRGAYRRKRCSVTHSDPLVNLHKSSVCLNQDLKTLFRHLKVPDGNGGILVPSFYSFRVTFDTQLANMGAPIVARAEALGQTTTRSTRRYDKRGPEFAVMLDQPVLRGKFEALAEPFLKGLMFSKAPQEGPEVPFIDPETGIYLGATGRCGCPGSPCGLSGSIECYLCGNFRAIEEGPHEHVLQFMQDRRQQMIAEGKPEAQYTRYDLTIFAVEEILRRIDSMNFEGRP